MEILPPESKDISPGTPKEMSFTVAWQNSTSLQKASFALLSAGTVASVAMFAVGQFFQTRGVQSVLTSRVFLLIAVIFPVAWLWQMAVLTKSKQWKWIAMVLTLLILVAALALDRAFPMPKMANTPAQVPIAPEVPTVEVRYLPSKLPFFVLPDSAVYLLRLNRKLSDWPDEIGNPSDSKKLQYPPHFKSKSLWPDLYICEITNHSDRDLVNVRMLFAISFRSIKTVAATFTRNGNQGSLTVPTRGNDGLSWASHHGNKTEAFTEGDEVERQSRVVVLPSIRAHGMGFVYVVNASSYPTRFDLPTRVLALVSGGSQEQQLSLIRPNVSALDAVSWWGMSPSIYRWPQTPDDSK